MMRTGEETGHSSQTPPTHTIPAWLLPTCTSHRVISPSPGSDTLSSVTCDPSHCNVPVCPCPMITPLAHSIPSKLNTAPSRRPPQQSPRLVNLTWDMSTGDGNTTFHHGWFCEQVWVQLLPNQLESALPSIALAASP